MSLWCYGAQANIASGPYEESHNERPHSDCIVSDRGHLSVVLRLIFLPAALAT